MNKPNFIFLCGSSAVGKTTLIDYVAKRGDVLGEVTSCVGMKARDEREKMGNPKWEHLLASEALSIRHQTAIHTAYMTYIQRTFDGALKIAPQNYLFERSPLDVAGYSFAFNLPQEVLYSQSITFLNYLKGISPFVNVVLMHMSINPDMPYAIEEARPPEGVRVDCAAYLSDILLYYRNSPTKPRNIWTDEAPFLPCSDQADYLKAILEKLHDRAV